MQEQPNLKFRGKKEKKIKKKHIYYSLVWYFPHMFDVQWSESKSF